MSDPTRRDAEGFAGNAGKPFWNGVPPLFADIGPEDVTRIVAAARRKQYARGEMLYFAGEPVKQVALVTAGSVKISQVGMGGAEVIVRLAVPADVLGALGLYSTGKHCTRATTFRNCQALVWEARDFGEVAKRYPVLHKNIFRIISGYLLELEERFREVATERVPARIAREPPYLP
jgi:CRP-like cAMP-binding protein